MVLLTIFPYSRPLWSRRVVFRAPELGLKAQSAAICWTLLVPAANVLNNATQTMNFMPWLRVSAPATCRSKCPVNKTQPSVSTKKFKIKGFLFLTTCLFVGPASDWEHISFLCFCETRTQMHACIILSIHGEHPRLQWVTPGYANSLPRTPPALLPGSHTGGIWNLLAAESHRAIKPSKAHKHTRARTSNNVGPTGCQQTQCILNLKEPQWSFFILSVSLYETLNYSSPPPLHKHHLGMSRGRILHFYP